LFPFHSLSGVTIILKLENLTPLYQAWAHVLQISTSQPLKKSVMTMESQIDNTPNAPLSTSPGKPERNLHGGRASSSDGHTELTKELDKELDTEHVGMQESKSLHGERSTDDATSSIQEFRVEDMTLARAKSLGYPTEESLPQQSTASSLSYVDLEKGIGSVVIKHQLGADNVEASDNPQSRQRSWQRPNLSRDPSWRISAPPHNIPKLPAKRERRVWRVIRYTLLAVYQRLFSLVFISNIAALITIHILSRHRHWSAGRMATAASTAAGVNITLTVLIRQDFVINWLYAICCWTPHSFPLRIRRLVAKVYEFGGIHSGCAVSAMIWFIIFTAFITKTYVNGDYAVPAVIAITHILLALLVSICALAIPHFRVVSHNTFEAVHRFAGWTAVALFWVIVLLDCKAQTGLPGSKPLGMLVIDTPNFWFLLLITFCIILPWLRLRKVDAVTERLSNHAVRMHFRYTDVGAVMGVRISHDPMKEWHSFATIPGPGRDFSVIISDAGDWTKKQIADPMPRYWVRGVPVAGVLRMALVFKRVVIVTTGSGIGPTLSMLHAHPLPARILWSTPNPQQTYGENILEAVGQADPQAMIINTRATGRPDMVGLAYHLYLESKAEAVFVLSNASLTRKVVYGMESRGIPAFGPVFDS